MEKSDEILGTVEKEIAEEEKDRKKGLRAAWKRMGGENFKMKKITGKVAVKYDKRYDSLDIRFKDGGKIYFNIPLTDHLMVSVDKKKKAVGLYIRCFSGFLRQPIWDKKSDMIPYCSYCLSKNVRPIEGLCNYCKDCKEVTSRSFSAPDYWDEMLRVETEYREKNPPEKLRYDKVTRKLKKKYDRDPDHIWCPRVEIEYDDAKIKYLEGVEAERFQILLEENWWGAHSCFKWKTRRK